MVNEATSGIEDELSERDLLFNAYFEDELTGDAREQFDRRLADDPDFAREFEDFRTFMGDVQKLPFEFAPPDFVERVQTRIRTRSRGRFFAEEFLFKSRVPYEVVALVMIIVMAAAYLLMGAPPDKQMRDVDVAHPPRLETR